jgi:DNA-binding MarR family transcriptional regulator
MTSTPSVLSRARPDAVQQLAQFRYRLRQFLRFSDRAARDAGVTPLQHQLMLGVAGFTGRGWATISELAECLQDRHNAVVALVNRAVRAGLVRKRRSEADRRVVRVELTARGQRKLIGLTQLHQEELTRVRSNAWPALAPGSARLRRTPSRSRGVG